MIELLVAILISLGSLTSAADFTAEYQSTHQAEVSQAQSIIDSNQYYYDERTGGVVVADGTGT